VCSIVRTASLLHFLCLREGLHLRSVPELAPVDAAEPTLAKLVVVVKIVGRRLQLLEREDPPCRVLLLLLPARLSPMSIVDD
jgi:hypothetical protein